MTLVYRHHYLICKLLKSSSTLIIIGLDQGLGTAMAGNKDYYRKIDKDYESVCACQRGDKCAFNDIVFSHQKTMYNIALRIVLLQEDAEDIVQEVFLNVYKNISNFNWDSKFSTYLYRSISNRSFNVLKKRIKEGDLKLLMQEMDLRTHPEVQALMISLQLEGSDYFYYKDLLIDSLICIRQLGEKYYKIFVLHTFENFKYQDIAEICDIELGTVRSRLNRARKQVRQCFEEIHGNIRDALR